MLGGAQLTKFYYLFSFFLGLLEREAPVGGANDPVHGVLTRWSTHTISGMFRAHLNAVSPQRPAVVCVYPSDPGFRGAATIDIDTCI